MLPLIYVTVILFVFFPQNALHSSAQEEDKKLWEAAKKELAQRTKEYLKRNPLSDELRGFIDDLKKTKRRKRQDHSNMYAIKDGEVVPLARLEESLNTESELGENFTVVPLIIPIALERNMTLKDRYERTTEDDFTFGGSSQRGILGRGEALNLLKLRKNGAAAAADEATTEETVAEDVIDDKLKSTSSSPELSKVLEDVQGLINSQKKGKSSSKEGALCNVTGHWDSSSGGVTFHIKKSDSGAEIRVLPLEPPSEDGFIATEKWNVTARIPFQQSAQVIITLTMNKGRRVGLFLGECRICDGSETITGDWMVGRTSSTCKDQKAAHSFFADVLRKNNVETLRVAHLKKIENQTSTAIPTT